MPPEHRTRRLVSFLSNHSQNSANPSTSAVFQAGGLLVVLVEVHRKSYLASMVPVIVNTILNEHQLVADIVAFVAKGLFPRSRLGEKQRGKILASWVTRKMETLAQFGIRDPDSTTNVPTTATAPTGGGATLADASSMTGVPDADRKGQQLQRGPSSLRHASAAESETIRVNEPDPSEQSVTPTARAFNGSAGPNYAHDQNQPYESSIVESPPLDQPGQATFDSESTPTNARGGGGYFPDHYAGGAYPADPAYGAPQAQYGRDAGYELPGSAISTGLDGGPGQAVPPRPPAKDEPSRTYVPCQPTGSRNVGGGRPRAESEEEWPQEALGYLRQARA